MEYKEKIYEIITELSGIQAISDTDTLVSDIGLDSLGMVVLLLKAEETFEIAFAQSDMNPFELSTVEDYVKLILKYMEGNADEQKS